MIVSIQFDDQNFSLAACIGRALVNYGVAEPETVNVPHVPVERADVPPKGTEGFERKPALGEPGWGAAVRDKTPEIEVIKTEDVVSEVVAPFGRVPTTPDVVPPTPTPIIPTTSPVGLPSRLDGHGVTFDPNYCGEAEKPFYGPGKRKGQWKKLRGLDYDEYDTWYAEQGQTSAVPVEPISEPVVDDGTAPPTTDTTAAFAGEPEPTPPPADDAPIGAGQLMKWISEQMNAGNLTQADVDSAYVTADVTPAQLFSPDDDTDAVGKLYGVLQACLA